MGLVGDLSGIGLLDRSLKPLGQSGEVSAASFAKWVQSMRWAELQDRVPAARACAPAQWWVAIPIQESDGALLGVFCVTQRPASPPAQPARFASALALRLKPLVDCVYRDLAAAVPARSKVQSLSERTQELEWLFQISSSLKGAVDDHRVVEELLVAATSRLETRKERPC